jgi:V/A-type H+/Na+-transporting ATPase subunit D
MSLENVSPTRINLIQTKRTLGLAESGRDILERKRDILLRELRHSIYDAERAREELNEALLKAYGSLQQANLARGSETVDSAALGSSLEANFLLDFRSVMGVTVPIVEFQGESNVKPDYGFGSTSVELDKAFGEFHGVLEFVAELARAEGITYQIARDVGRTQRRVNALNHVLIPLYRATVKRIELVLEEKDREEFVRMKRVKRIIGRRVSV